MRKEILFLGILIVCVSLFGVMVSAGGSTSDSKDTTASAIVPGWVSIIVGTLNFGDTHPSIPNDVSLSIEVGDETNVAVDIYTVATSHFTGSLPATPSFGIGAMKGTPDGGTQFTYIKDVQNLIASDRSWTYSYAMPHTLTVPAGTIADTYTAQMTVTAKI